MYMLEEKSEAVRVQVAISGTISIISRGARGFGLKIVGKRNNDFRFTELFHLTVLPLGGNKLLVRRFPSAVRSSIYQRLIREFVRWRTKKGEVGGTIRRFSALVDGASEGNCLRKRDADLKCRFEF